jgi:hypothetical protein
MAVPSHSPVTTTAFLKALDPSADRFTFQLFRDPKHRKLEANPPGLALVQHCGCEEASALARTWNTPEWGFGFYVTINETNFAGRKRENIVRVRAVLVDADEDLPGVISRLQGLLPTSAIVRSSAGRAQFYWWVVDDIPVEQFEPVQRALIAKLGTDPNVHDLPSRNAPAGNAASEIGAAACHDDGGRTSLASGIIPILSHDSPSKKSGY